MNAIIFFFGSGLAFFVGIAMILAAVMLVCITARRAKRVISELLTVIGGLLIVASATPLPDWLYVLAGSLTLTWLIAERRQRTGTTRIHRFLRIAVVGTWFLSLSLELPHHVTPTIPPTPNRQLCIIGDSISAGTGEKDIETWPRLFARQHPWAVDDRSKMGATVRSIHKLVEERPLPDGVILLEIGGNDLLGGTPLDEYERGLEELLIAVQGSQRTLVMWELPLPPLHNGFGRVQRRLADEHGVILIPKRVFLAVLTTSGATTDGIHLSSQGHRQMCDEVGRLIATE